MAARDQDNIKIVVCGHGGIGKSNLVIRFIQNHFCEEYDPTIEDSYRKQAVVDGTLAMLEILDTSGAEDLSYQISSGWVGRYLKETDCVLVLFNLTDAATFNEAEMFINELSVQKNADKRVRPILLVGTKADLIELRTVSRQEGEERATRYGAAAYFETSAKMRLNVDEVFHEAVRLVRKTRPSIPAKEDRIKCVIA